MSNSESQALAQVGSIADLFNLNTWSNNIENLGFRYFQKEAFDTLYGDKKEVKEYLEYENDLSTDRINDLVYEQPLEVSTRSDWQQSQEEYEASEFNILLCTGGPAVRIFGNCDGGYAENIELQHQDWFTPWETVHSLSDNQKDAMEWFCNFFVY